MGIEIQENVPLAQHTTFKIGGPAKFFTIAKSEEELIEALEFAKENNLKYFILGGGSNVLVSDKGFDGLVIKMKITHYNFQNSIIECGAGNSLLDIIHNSIENNMKGLEWAAGIPGTIGGAIRGNAGAFGSSMSDSVIEVRTLKIIADGKHEILNLRKEDCKFGYRESIFKNSGSNLIILSAKLKLEAGNKGESKDEIYEILKKRKDKQPQYPSAGSFFKNPVVTDKKIIEKFERDTGMKVKEDKVPAGWLIEGLDMHGEKIGGAQISEKHANFIINTGNAKAEDVIMLASIIKQRVKTKYHIQFQEEIQLAGF